MENLKDLLTVQVADLLPNTPYAQFNRGEGWYGMRAQKNWERYIWFTKEMVSAHGEHKNFCPLLFTIDFTKLFNDKNEKKICIMQHIKLRDPFFNGQTRYRMHSVRSPRQEITRLICIEKINDIQVKMSFGHDISNSIFTYDKKSELKLHFC